MTIASSRHFSKLVQDFVGNFDSTAIKQFFPCSPFAPDADVRAILAKRLAEYNAPSHAGVRQAIVERITETHRIADGLTEAVRSNLGALASDNCMAIVTGQQVGLLAGPLYTLYKTLHTIILTKEYASKYPEYQFVPVFWQETEDHDFAEVSSVGIVNAEFQLKHISYVPQDPPERKQVGGMNFEADALASFFTELRNSLQKTEFTDEVVALCERCYQPGVSFADAQSAMLCRLFAEDGLLILNANSRTLKSFVAPLFKREFTTAPLLSDTLNAYSEPLKVQYHAQIDANGANSFFVEDGKRYKLHKEANGFRYGDKHISEADLINSLHSEPERFSMNVVMRPIVQDTLLPTAAYIAGPGEIAYFSQLSAVYTWAEMQMPVILPRISLSLIDDRFYKLAEKFGTSVESLLEFGPELVRELLKSEKEDAIASAFDRVIESIEIQVESLRNTVESSDSTLGAALTTLKGKSVTQLRDFGSKVAGAERKKQQSARQQFEKALQVLLPENKLQERELNLVYFLNRYGVGFWHAFVQFTMKSSFSLREHHLIPISTILDSAKETTQ
jgi:bacillithiol synthase